MKSSAHQVYISLGSNIQPAENLRRAVDQLRRLINVNQIADTWETPPVGTTIGENYYNTAIKAETLYSPDELKYLVIRPLESSLGRVRTPDKYAPRPIDLDVIIFDDRLLDERLWTSPYLTLPIAQLYPDYLNKQTGLTLKETARRFLQSCQAIPHPEVFETERAPSDDGLDM